jgi:hypothetical protein
MKGPEFIIALVFIIGIFSLLKARMGIVGRHERIERSSQEDSGEAARLREEVGQLKERIQVLERITVDKENSLARQIDELRDR